MADPAIGGAILGEACHFVDLMYWLLDAEPHAVSPPSRLPVDRKHPIGENNLTATFHFADGSIGSLTYCTVGSRTSGGRAGGGVRAGRGRQHRGLPAADAKRSLSRHSRRWFADKGYMAQMQSFFASLRVVGAPAVTVIDGARATIGCLTNARGGADAATVAIDLQSWGIGQYRIPGREMSMLPDPTVGGRARLMDSEPTTAFVFC